EHGSHALYSVSGLDGETYSDSTQARLAAERCMDIIARVASQLSNGFRRAHPEFPWQRIAALAKLLDFPEGEPDDEQAWAFLHDPLPRLVANIHELLAEPASGGEAEA